MRRRWWSVSSLVESGLAAVLAAGLAAGPVGGLAAQREPERPPVGNSTRKIRPEPSAQAARAGSAVGWRESLAAARAEAAGSGRPVFWYVPTVPGSRMDRKPEIDRYMLAGPFSSPAVLALLDACFVPVRAVPDRDLARSLELVPLRFVEPGFVVLAPGAADAEPVVVARADELTTLAPDWFVARLLAALPAEQRDAARARTVRPAAVGTDGPWTGIDRLDAAVAAWRAGDRAAELAAWRTLAAAHPDAPLGWKAAAEVEGHGPFRRGFEVLDGLPAAALAPGPRGTRAPAGAFDRGALRSAAVGLFERMQEPNGGFEDSRYDFGGTDSLPNVWVAVTALVATALLEIAPDLDGELRDRAERVLARALDYATDDARLAPADRDELIWAHLYRCRLLARWLELRPDDAPRLAPRLGAAVAAIVAMQGEDGAWYHEYPNPFVSGSCLVALGAARQHGVEVDRAVIEDGVRALLRCRADDGAITYGQVRAGGAARAAVAGGVGRMPLAEHALGLWDRGDQARLAAALEASFAHEGELFAVRKYDDHASRHGYGGFFFWYDLHVRTEALAALADAERRGELFARQDAGILTLAELDGCFVDSHELGRVYGTAMAMICLARSGAD